MSINIIILRVINVLLIKYCDSQSATFSESGLMMHRNGRNRYGKYRSAKKLRFSKNSILDTFKNEVNIELSQSPYAPFIFTLTSNISCLMAYTFNLKNVGNF